MMFSVPVLIAAMALPQSSEIAAQPVVAPKEATVVVSKAADNGQNSTTNEKSFVTIKSDHSHYLRKEGVVILKGNVTVSDPQFNMYADDVTIFLDGTNDLKRIVAVGNVAITNGLKSATCVKATYNKKLSRLVLYGDEKTGTKAILREDGPDEKYYDSYRLIYWIDLDQVDGYKNDLILPVNNKGNNKDKAKQFFGR